MYHSPYYEENRIIQRLEKYILNWERVGDVVLKEVPQEIHDEIILSVKLSNIIEFLKEIGIDYSEDTYSDYSFR